MLRRWKVAILLLLMLILLWLLLMALILVQGRQRCLPGTILHFHPIRPILAFIPLLKISIRSRSVHHPVIIRSSTRQRLSSRSVPRVHVGRQGRFQRTSSAQRRGSRMSPLERRSVQLLLISARKVVTIPYALIPARVLRILERGRGSVDVCVVEYDAV